MKEKLKFSSLLIKVLELLQGHKRKRLKDLGMKRYVCTFSLPVLLATLLLLVSCGETIVELLGDSYVPPYCLDDRLTNEPYANSGEEDVADGSAANPYYICTGEQLQKLGETTDDWSKHFVQKGDIDLTDYPNDIFNIIGSVTTSFTGSFDGGGYKITGFSYYEEVSYVGLFGYIEKGATISNVNLENVSVYGYANVGGLAGYNYGTIQNCTISGTVESSEAAPLVSDKGTGGLVGFNHGGTITSSRSYATVTGRQNVGGLVGINESTGTQALIQDSRADGNVSGVTYVGGFVGFNRAPSMSNMSTGDVIATGAYAGGFSGGNSATINDSISAAYTVTAHSASNDVSYLTGQDIAGEYGTGSNCHYKEMALVNTLDPAKVNNNIIFSYPVDMDDIEL